MDSCIHDSITQSRGSFDALIRNLADLRKVGIRIRIKTPLMEKNRESINEIKNYCQLNGFEYLVSPLIFPKINGDSAPKNYVYKTMIYTQ
jgi:sulfatase maturation enzyme AslB (radical SAM superfamily)